MDEVGGDWVCVCAVVGVGVDVFLLMCMVGRVEA